MIKKEYYKTRNDGVKLYRTYSDTGLTIKQKETGNIYEEAIDVENAPYTYEENLNIDLVEFNEILEKLWEEASLNGLK